MAYWKRTCDDFKKVRELIEEEDNIGILTELSEICNKLAEGDEDWENDFEDLAEEISIAIYDEDDMSNEDVDYYLSEFYDLCDAARIWLGL